MDAGIRNALRESRQKAAQGQLEEAIRMVETILADTHEALRLMADLRLRSGERAEAEVVLRKIVTLYPQDIKAALRLARLLEVDRPDEAEAQLRRIFELDNSRIDVLMRLSQLFQRRGEFVEGIALLRHALDMEPSNTTANLHLAELLEPDDPDGAEVHLQRVLVQHPANSAALLRLSFIAQRRGALDEAMEYVHRLLHIDPANEKAALRLSLLLEPVDLEKAEDHLRQFLTRAPDSKVVLLRLAQIREKRHDPAEAACIVRDLAAAHPGDAEIGLRHAHILAETGHISEAVSVIEGLADSPSVSTKVLYQLGDLKRRNGDLAGAEAAFTRAAAMQPGDTRTLLSLANAQHATGNTAQALVTLDKLLASAPEDVSGLLRKAELLGGLRYDQEASAAFERLVRKPDAPLAAWIGLARASGRTTSTKAAIAVLHRAVERVGPNPRLALELARHTLNSGCDAQAQEIVADGLRCFPEYRPLLEMACHLHVLAGRFETAEGLFPQSANPSPRDEVKALRFRANLASVRWRIDEAVDMHEKIGASAYATVGDFHAEAGLRAMQLDVVGARNALRQAAGRERPGPTARQQSANVSQGLVGQFVNDIWTDSAAISAIRDASQDGSWKAWQAAIGTYSHHTGAAVSFLIHLRRTGRFAGQPNTNDPGGIPPQIYQFWDSPDIPSDVGELTESWRDLNPGWIYQRYNLITAKAFLQSLGDPRPARAFRQIRTAAGKADILRLAVLFYRGGVYADADDRCVSPLEPFMQGRSLVLRQEKYGTIGNNFIASAPGHPVIGNALEHAVDAVLRGDSEMIWLSTGPGLLTRIFATLLAAEGSLHLPALGQSIWVTDAHELRQFCASNCSTAYKQTERNWQVAEFAQRRKSKGAAISIAS